MWPLSEVRRRVISGGSSVVKWVPNTAKHTGMWKYLPREAGEWEEHEETKETDRFVDGYGVLFEDFRASTHMSKSQEADPETKAYAAKPRAVTEAVGRNKAGQCWLTPN